MKKLTLTITLLAAMILHAPAATLYVDLNSSDPVLPYASWSTAATNIQDAVDASTNGDLILVTNGIYSGSGHIVYGSPTSLFVNRAVGVQSVNGPSVTAINGDSGMRCVYLTNGATLSGFTLTNGNAESGGGVYCESTNAILTNCDLTGNLCTGGLANAGGGAVYQGTLDDCILSNNVAASYTVSGGAAYESVLNDCLIISNSASFGGGAANSTLNDCTIMGNSAPFSVGSTSWGGGTYMCTANHCLIAGNFSASSGGGDCYGILSYCILSNNICIVPSVSGMGQGGGSYQQSPNGSYTPMLYNCLVVSNYCNGNGGGVYTVGSSPILTNCTIVGNTATNEGGGVYGGTLKNCIVYGNYCPSAFSYSSNVYSASLSSCWTGDPLFVYPGGGDFHLQSNSPCINAGNNAYVTSATDLDGEPRIVGGTVDIGAYEFQGNIRYVSLSSTNPIAPYSDWSVAATNIQDAVDAATNGDLILVTNGVYQSGGIVTSDGATNCVVVTNVITLESVNGPAVTLIDGRQLMRCVYLTNNTVLTGFTLANGNASGIGGGAFGGTLISCILTNNSAFEDGGGAYGCILSNCLIVGNNAYFGGGAYGGTLNTSSVCNNSAHYGGGVFFGVANNSLISSNGASYGGGAYSNILTNCVLQFNAAGVGSGANYSTLANCTVVSNIAPTSSPLAPPTTGGGIAGGSAINCIVYYNFADRGSNFFNTAMSYCCATPLPTSGLGNITNEPAFVNLTNGDFHLQSNSPCINSGNNAYVSSPTDLDGDPRIVGGTVDIGAYEYQAPTSVISYAWLQQYGLPTDGSVDYADLDGTPFNVYQDWVAGLDPTNALSVLAMLPPVPTNNPAGLVVSWESVSNRTYFLQSSTNLAAQPAFSTIQSNIVGQPNLTSFMDTSATNAGLFFYRVGVQQ